jgi:hypothetical protein
MPAQGHRRTAVVWAATVTGWAIGTAFEAWVLMLVLGALHHQFLAGDGYPWGFWACAAVACVRQLAAQGAAMLWDAGMARLMRFLTRRSR